MAFQILLVEDDPDISDVITMQLEKANYEVTVACDGETAEKAINGDLRKYDVLVLDWMLPGVSGYELCRKVRKENQSDVPILMVTAKAEPEHIVAGLDAGADDYVTKPFDMNVFLARVRSQIRRRENSSVDSLKIESLGLSIDPTRYEVCVKGEYVKMTPSEFRILQCMISRPGNVFTRKQIVEYINGMEQVAVTERVIDTHMVSLRKKLSDLSKHIETIRGIGYKFIDSFQ